MKTVDARGLSCPEPIMLTEEALKAGEFPVKILVSEPHQKSQRHHASGKSHRRQSTHPTSTRGPPDCGVNRTAPA